MTVTPTHPLEALSLESLRARPGVKWNLFEEDVLPCWVAEMDFPLADAVKRAITEQVATNDLGYQYPTGLPGLREAVAGRLAKRYDYAAEPEHVLPLDTTGAGINLAVRAFTAPGDEVLLLTPLYPPFKKAAETAGRVPVEVELVNGEAGYGIDLAALEEAVTERTRLLMLCNPHNPVGRVFTEDELTALAELALRHDLLIVSDDLHADLLLEGQHFPIARLGEEVAARTVILYGPTKTFNLPGLQISFAISSNPELLERLQAAGEGLVAPPNILSQAATIGAYEGGDGWLAQVVDYLRANRDHLLKRVGAEMPRVRVHAPEATYLAWLDLRAFDLGDDLSEALAERARVGVNDGATFGAGGSGFARFNFATPRPILDEALDRLRRVLG